MKPDEKIRDRLICPYRKENVNSAVRSLLSAFLTSRFPVILLLLLIALHGIGCAPSVRYTRSADGEIHLYVPRDWDYRKNYKVPQDRLLSIIQGWIGVRYKYGGMNRRGVDCSGFVCLVYRDLNGMVLPHSSRKMHRLGRQLSISEARSGDLVFFRGGLFNTINHVGIYISDNKFAHASSSNGVRFSSLDESYYKKRFAEIRRLF
jgi:probable lipoprotein NlpC